VQPLASSLVARGWSASVPHLRFDDPSPSRFSELAIAHCSSADIVIGHSGAGVFLSSIAARVGATSTVYIDAVLPPAHTTFRPTKGFIKFIDTLPTVDGTLPPWPDWWPPEPMTLLVPDEDLRSNIVSECPRLPRSFYDEKINLPAEWWTKPAAYLQLSPTYEDDRRRAERFGWPTARLEGRHLDLAVFPDLVADLVVRLVNEIASGPHFG
jgi:hypothetical protein